MPTNCGIAALSQLIELKNISAFTLVHAARDNGLNLFVFKVNNLDDLSRVQRPAIFHQEDHFVYIKNGEPLPKGKYTGFVLSSAVLGRVIGLQEAKFIKGGKNFLTGKNKDGVKEGGGALGSILGVVGAVVGSILLPGIGTGLGATISGAIGGGIGGAAGAAATGDNPLVSGALGALGGAGIGQVVGGLSAGVASAAGGSALSSNVPAVGQGAFNAAKAGIGTTFSPVTQSAGLAGQVGAFNAVNAGASSLAGASGLNNSAVTNGGQGFSANGTPATGAATAANPGNSIIGSLGNSVGNAIGSNPLGTAASLAGAAGVFGSTAPQPSSVTPGENYSALNTFLGSTPQGSANNSLSLASTNANTDIVNTSIPDLQKQFTGNNQRTLDTINTAYDNQKQSLVHQYAQAGQNFTNSSELQQKVDQLEQKRTNDLTLAQQELQDQALGQAVQVKQTALSQGMQAGQFNQGLAMQLASLTGDQQNLQYAIANNDYTSFQQIMGKLLTMGIPQSVSISNGGQKSTVSTGGSI